MAKKLFHNRVKASMCPIYEDISDEEFDPLEIQIVEKPFSYMGRIFRVSGIEQSDQSEFFSTHVNNSRNVSEASACITSVSGATATENVLERLIVVKNNETEKETFKVNVKQEPKEQTYHIESSNEAIDEYALNKRIKEEPDSIEAYSDNSAEISQGFVRVREEFKEKVVVKTSEEKLLLEWSDISDVEERPNKMQMRVSNSEKASCSEQLTSRVQPNTMIKEHESIHLNDFVQKQVKVATNNSPSAARSIVSSSPPSIPYFYLEQMCVSDSEKASCSEPFANSVQPGTMIKDHEQESMHLNDFVQKELKMPTKKLPSAARSIASSSPPSIPYFYLEQKELLAQPWKINTKPQKISLSRKKAVKDNTEQFNCPHCTRKYWKQTKLREHVRINHFEKMETAETVVDRYQVSKCPDCKKQLKTKTDMYVHRLTHLVPSFKIMNCPLCGESQYTYNTLKYHVRTEHKVEEKWFCPVCPDARTFTQNHSLLIHISNFHFDAAKDVPTQYPCNQCHKQFGSKALLGRHVNSIHLGPFVKHLYYKMLKCEVCGKDYERFPDLKKHIKSSHMNPSLVPDTNGEQNDFAAKLNILKKSLVNNSKNPTLLAKVSVQQSTDSVFNSAPPTDPIRQC
eukprot:GFUD01003922.1.p1 GENE.GFUD01003922.1~~GFUD01003922.1.p1  ORF type:complete len:626 (-),score=124.50 GFUD01003922.1:39-1916(-)